MPPPLRTLVRDVVRSSRGHDLPLYAAGVTFYAAIALVPLLLVGLWLAGVIAGDASVRSLGADLASVLPAQAGPRQATRFLADAGTRLTPSQVLAALLPASIYGEGLVRAFDRLSRHGDRGRRPLRGRLGTLVVIAVSPLMLLAGLGAAGGLGPALPTGLGGQLLGIYVAFLISWIVTSLLLTFAYRGLAPERPCTRAVLWGAFSTGSMVAGSAMGFLLFLSLGLDVGRAYGGSSGLAVAAISLVWLYGLHVVVLAGYVLTLQLDARQGRPTAVPVESHAVRNAA